ncbi:MAG: DUF6159 family protein [Planctomycetota bacterium]|nr:DUF6159 family protein [Planctomycetota bacterium]
MGFRVKRSAELFKCSWQVLKTDKTLALFPVISAAASLLLAAAFLAPIFSVPTLRSDAAGFIHDMEQDHRALEEGNPAAPLPENPEGLSATGNETTTSSDGRSPAPTLSAIDVGFLIYGFVFFLACSFVVIFFNAALVGATNRKFEGRPTGIMVGLGIACQRLPQILAWAVVNAIVGTLLRVLEERMGLVGRIVIAVIGVAWSIATYFAIPTLVIEGVGPFKAVSNSVGAIKRTWGESLVIAIGFGCVGALVSVAGIGAIVAGAAIGVSLLSEERIAEAIGFGGTVASLGIAILILWSVLSSTLMAITRTALYRYAVDGVVPGGFNESALAGAFVDRRKPTDTR